jgi:hypothetical protein
MDQDKMNNNEPDWREILRDICNQAEHEIENWKKTDS